jgi:hypothetical protein
MLFQNVCHQSPSDMVPHPRKMETSTTLLQKYKISQLILQDSQRMKHFFLPYDCGSDKHLYDALEFGDFCLLGYKSLLYSLSRM